jgi:membrane protease subunit (stomatin/prohibitin family)
MAIIDVLKYDGPNNALVWKWRPAKGGNRQEELRLGTQLVVNETQEAIFLKGGKVLDIFPPGTHTLKTQNLPLLANIIGLAFGGDSPFKAEVYFVNKAVAMDAKWGITPFNLIEPNFKVPIPITARGSFAMKIIDTHAFLTNVVGTVPDTDTDTIKQAFRGVITEKVKGAISKIVRDQQLSPLELEQIVGEVSEAVKGFVDEALRKYGMQIELFNIEAIPIIDDDPKVKKIVDDFHRIMSEDMEERMRLKRRGENLEVYRTERTFDTTEKAAESIGNTGGDGGSDILGTVVGMGMAMPIAGTMGNMMNKATQPLNDTIENATTCNDCNAKIPADARFCLSCGKPTQSGSTKQDTQQEKTVKCDKCSHSFSTNSKFCPSCGDPYNPCPKCGADNPDTQKICCECNTPLPVKCECGESNLANTKFCSGCGKSLQIVCSDCGASLQAGQKFCNECGTKTK